MIIDRELFKSHQNIAIWDEIDCFKAVKIHEDDEEWEKVKDSEILEFKKNKKIKDYGENKNFKKGYQYIWAYKCGYAQIDILRGAIPRLI